MVRIRTAYRCSAYALEALGVAMTRGVLLDIAAGVAVVGTAALALWLLFAFGAPL